MNTLLLTHNKPHVSKSTSADVLKCLSTSVGGNRLEKIAEDVHAHLFAKNVSPPCTVVSRDVYECGLVYEQLT